MKILKSLLFLFVVIIAANCSSMMEDHLLEKSGSFSLNGKILAVTETSFKFSARINNPGVIYYALTTLNEQDPAKEEVISGCSDSFIAHGTSESNIVEFEVNITSLDPDTSYNLYLIGKTSSLEENEYSSLKKLKVKTSYLYLTVESPNGGEEFDPGSTYEISWATNCPSEAVKIDLYKDGLFYSNIVSSTVNDGSYSWSLSNTHGGINGFKIKISLVDLPYTFDDSDNVFKINGPWINLTDPNDENDKWYIGTTHQITWEYSSALSGTNVRIELYKEDTASTYIISSSTPCDGSFSWDISEALLEQGYMPGKDYRVKIAWLSNEVVYDFSDNNFELMLAPNIYFLLDDSGSMGTNLQGGRDLSTILKEQMNLIADDTVVHFNIGMAVLNSLSNSSTELLDLKKGYSADEFRNAISQVGKSGSTPTGGCLEKIKDLELYKLNSDQYDQWRKKAVIVITDGEPANYIQCLKESLNLSYFKNVPVYYLGFSNIDGRAENAGYVKQLQQMAIYGGTDNPDISDKNWYPINEAGQIQVALNEIMYGDIDSLNDNIAKLELDCTPDSGNSVYFNGSLDILGGNGGNIRTNVSASTAYVPYYDSSTGTYYAYVRDTGEPFQWQAVQFSSYGLGIVYERAPLHTDSNYSPAFNGWNYGSEMIIEMDISDANVGTGETVCFMVSTDGSSYTKFSTTKSGTIYTVHLGSSYTNFTWYAVKENGGTIVSQEYTPLHNQLDYIAAFNGWNNGIELNMTISTSDVGSGNSICFVVRASGYPDREFSTSVNSTNYSANIGFDYTIFTWYVVKKDSSGNTTYIEKTPVHDHNSITAPFNGWDVAPEITTIWYYGSSAPKIWMWESNGTNNVSELMGYSWDSRPTMTSAGNSWYKFEIPNERDNFTSSLQVILGDDGVVSRIEAAISSPATSKNWYYKNESWTTTMP